MTYWLWSLPPQHYPALVRAGTFAVRRQGRAALQQIRPGDRVFAYLPGQRVLAGLFEATSAPFEDATALVVGEHRPHRLRVRPLAALSPEARVPYEAFYDGLEVLDRYGERDTPDLRFRAVVQRVVHRLPRVDGAFLEFLVRTRATTDPERLLALADRYRAEQRAPAPPEDAADTVAEPAPGYWDAAAGDPGEADPAFDRAAALDALVRALKGQGFVYPPWAVAAYVTALRTRPFVILAGITGVGKSRLPRLVGAATGGPVETLPVRPDWADPADTLGYTDLAGRFRPGALLQAVRRATDDPGRFHTLVLDEMNLARPEHYLADVLSRIEQPDAPRPLVPSAPDAAYAGLVLPPNLGLAGTVNIDESAHTLSRKVLDRAFVLELAGRDLEAWERPPEQALKPGVWPAAAWRPRARRLAELGALKPEERAAVERAVAAVSALDSVLAPAGLGLGFRTRDEVALFTLHALDTPAAFRTASGAEVDPLDLALAMKVLPRLEGAGAAVEGALKRALEWAWGGGASEPGDRVDTWDEAGRPDAIPGAAFPRTAARLAAVLERLAQDGYAAFWA